MASSICSGRLSGSCVLIRMKLKTQFVQAICIQWANIWKWMRPMYLGILVWEERVEVGVEDLHMISPVLLNNPPFNFGSWWTWETCLHYFFAVGQNSHERTERERERVRSRKFWRCCSCVCWFSWSIGLYIYINGWNSKWKRTEVIQAISVLVKVIDDGWVGARHNYAA